jgi:hypothetical protein
MKALRIVGPVQHNPEEEGVAGMGWFVPYLDANRLDRLLWQVLPQWSKNKRPTRDHAIEIRERLLARKGSFRVDDWDLFIAICKMVQAAKACILL